MYTYEEFQERVDAVLEAMEFRQPTLRHVIDVDAGFFDDGDGQFAKCEIEAVNWLGIDRDRFDKLIFVTLFVYDKGWQIDADLEGASDVPLVVPAQPEFGVDDDPHLIADYVIQLLQAIKPALVPNDSD